MMEKGKKILILFFVFLFAPFALACMKTTKGEPPSTTQLLVRPGEEFLIKKGQKAVLAGTGFELEILRFYNQPCPPNVKCIWSGIGIEFEYRNDSQVARGINLVRAFGYETTVIRSDYESYAILKITRGVN